jgi:thiol-disulfide isomerase/thioredoxin
MSQKVFIGVVALAVVGIIAAAAWSRTLPGQYDAFAQCLGEKGAVFYGAFWCPHCQEQKKLFGRSAKRLPYVECSLPGGKGQTQVCIDKKITGYPTWTFADGSVVSEVMQPSTLGDKTGCELPTN